jgi:hypothetical protein
MILDSKIEYLKGHFGCWKPEDWRDVRPEWILAQHGIGQATLDHLRVWLAARGLTLKDDQTPAYWQQHLDCARIGQTLGEDDVAATCPFTVLIDSQEKMPFTFQGLQTDADQGKRPLIIPHEWRSLGSAHGDYSIDGFEGLVHVERKSIDDALGTILGWGERRERFTATLENLAGMDAAAVVIECSFAALLQYSPSRGKKSAEENRKILFRQVLAWQQDYRVPWLFCDSRRMAEIATFRILERYFRKHREKKKPRCDADAVLESL